MGEKVDFYRTPGQKDSLGWSDPAEVVDVSRATRGVVTLRWQNRTIEAQLSNVRRHMHFLSLLSVMDETEYAFPIIQGNVWSRVRSTIETINPRGSVHAGHHRGVSKRLFLFISLSIFSPGCRVTRHSFIFGRFLLSWLSEISLWG